MTNLQVFLCLFSLAQNLDAAPQWNKFNKYLENPSVQRFREYVRIDTSKDENLVYAVKFLAQQATDARIPYTVYEPAGKPIFVATLQGSDPSLPAIMLNSHMDVVKVDASSWKYPPFDAFMDENGDIYGRGTQDAKDVGIQCLEAMRRIKEENVTLLRTMHLTFMPDEETGGYKGMKEFIKTEEFKSLNIGFALDEGLTSSDDSLFATFADRRPWQMLFTIHGVGGHGQAMPDGSAMEEAYKFITAVMKYRDVQKSIKNSKELYDLTGYNSININVIEGGLMVNIIPSKIDIMIDMRLAPDTDVEEVEGLVKSWMEEAGNRTEVSYIRRELTSGITTVDDTNAYWTIMQNTLNNIGVKVRPIVLSATSDMLVVRNLGIPAIGFSAKANTVSRIHTENEYLNVETFLKGINIYTELLKGLGNVP